MLSIMGYFEHGYIHIRAGLCLPFLPKLLLMKITNIVWAILACIVIASLSYMLGADRMRHKYESRIEALEFSIWTDSASNVRPVRLNSGSHVCSDSTHVNCDSMCECDGMECLVLKRDYEISIYMDTLWLWDGPRFVGKYTTNWKNQIDELLLKDNE
jgi:hypothetical protein